MPRKPRVINFEAENRERLEQLRSMIGQQVPLSSAYTRGVRSLLIAIEGDRATLRFPNAAILTNVPLRDLVDDAGYWKA